MRVTIKIKNKPPAWFVAAEKRGMSAQAAAEAEIRRQDEKIMNLASESLGADWSWPAFAGKCVEIARAGGY